ncbi:saccharopine dehydrogenase NADP-binding domain-containing protein [bacterium]|nr:saccharopine dehydrogenase NADP-binding domain-containing protein [bacterium]
MKKILVIGGYGTVGRVVTDLLAKDERLMPVIAGRNEAKARELAQKFKVEWRRIDIGDKNSIKSGLPDIALIINCFSGPFTHTPLLLPELSANFGIHYLDVAGSYEYSERFIKLNQLASQNNVTLITALGANPGIPGIALMNAAHDFEKLDSGKIIFVLGARLDGVSISSLKELKHMLYVKPLVWKKPRWIKPDVSSRKEYVGKPFDRKVYLGVSVTRDLLSIPALIDLNELSFWSGSQNSLQGLVMIAGLKLGLTYTDHCAGLFLKVLKLLGKSEHSISDALIKIECVGTIQGFRHRKTMEMYCDENYATALAPVIVCQQILEQKITRPGAFLPPEIVPAQDFMLQLEKYDTHYSETIEKTQ